MTSNHERSPLDGMSLHYRAVHNLLVTSTECMIRAIGIARQQSLDPAVIAEINASMALANAARAMVIAIHQTRGFLMKD